MRYLLRGAAEATQFGLGMRALAVKNDQPSTGVRSARVQDFAGKPCPIGEKDSTISAGIIGLTYHPTTCSTADDRPAHETEREIEVTPEMIEAGALILSDMFDTPLDWLTRDRAALIYRSMQAHKAIGSDE